MYTIILLRPDISDNIKLSIHNCCTTHICKHGDIIYMNAVYYAYHYSGELINIMNPICKTITIPTEITNSIANILNYYDNLHKLLSSYHLEIILSKNHDYMIKQHYVQVAISHVANDYMLIDYCSNVKNFIHVYKWKKTLIPV